MKSWRTWLIVILLVSAAWKIVLLALDVVPLNSDEAIVGLMARHILLGERPIFFYGQSYMGSLDAILVALGFRLLGEAAWVIRLVQGLLYLGVLSTTVWLGKEATGSVRIGLLAAALLAIPTTNVSLYTTISLGGYGETLLIGNLLLVLAIRLSRRARLSEWLAMGFLAGFGLWANGLTLVYSIPAIVFALFHQKETWRTRPFLLGIGALILGGAVGATPWWIYAWQNGLTHLVGELLGSAVSVEQGNLLARSASHLVNLLLLGIPAIFGMRPPWGITWLALPLIPFALAAWGWVLIYFFRSLGKNQPGREVRYLFLGVGITLFGGFLFTSFGVDPSGRYFLPLAVPLALAAADFALHSPAPKGERWAVVMVILVFQVWGNVQAALTYPPGFTTQFDATTILEHRYDPELIRFLQSRQITRGYTHYWVAYPLAFQSGETLIFTPRLPYHQDLRYTPRDNRYALYNDLVEGSAKVAYITARNPELDQKIVSGFSSLQVQWVEETIGDYHIYYDLSRPVRPDVLGFGSPSP